LLIGWFGGMIAGTVMVVIAGCKFAIYALHLGSLAIAAEVGVYALAADLIVAVVLTLDFDAIGMKRLTDRAQQEDYEDAGKVTGTDFK